MFGSVWAILCWLTAGQSIATTEPSGSVCPAQLRNKIEAIANRPQLRRARLGVLVETLSPAVTLYSRDAGQYFVPASNAKLLTTAAALQRNGPQFRIRTSVYGSSDDSVQVVGRGDPSLTDAQLAQLAQQLSRQGIRQVSHLFAVDSYFRGQPINPSWEWEDINSDYGAAVNSLILNQNVEGLTLFPSGVGRSLRVVWSDPTEAGQWQVENRIAVKSDEPSFISVSRDLAKPVLHLQGQLGGTAPVSLSLPVLNPAEHFLQHFRHALAVQKIAVAAASTSDSLAHPSQIRELAFVESPPLSQLLVETNQNSNNLYAEVLLRTLGTQTSDSSPETDKVGLQILKATLTDLGVDSTGYVLVDGSGLSRHNLVSPEALVQTLRAMAQSKVAAVYRASLPVAGISGTLQNRFRNTTAQGILQAKTGSMSGVAAISGYLNDPDYEPLVFSAIVNQSDQSAPVLRQSLDEIVLLLTKLHQC